MTLLKNFNELNYIYTKLVDESCKMDGYDDLSVNNYQYILAIDESKSITTTKLSEVMGVKKASVIQMIQSLIDKGYVMKTQSIEDKRSTYIELTEKGQVLMKSEKTIYEYMMDKIKKSLTEEEISSFEILLDKVVKAVQS